MYVALRCRRELGQIWYPALPMSTGLPGPITLVSLVNITVHSGVLAGAKKARGPTLKN